MESVTIIADFPLFQDKVHGGMQRLMEPVLRHLAQSFNLDIFCGERSDISIKNCKLFPAFTETCVLKDDFRPLLVKSIQQATLLVSLETAYPYDRAHCKKVLILGGLAYDWSLKVLKSCSWDGIVVPSSSARDKLSSLGYTGTVIANGFNWDIIRPRRQYDLLQQYGITQQVEKKILISPHRPDRLKGHFESIILTRRLIEKRIDSILLIPRQEFFMTPKGFYAELKKFANNNLSTHSFYLHDWIPKQLISAYYSIADMTLALGTAEEGFGAVIVESLASLTPVLSTGHGATHTLVPARHGLYLTNNGYSRATAELAHQILSTAKIDLRVELKAGYTYVRQHYRQSSMIDAYLNFFKRTINNARALT